VRIGVVGSMQLTERMLQLRDELNALGHDAYITSLASPFVGRTDEEKEQIKLHQKKNCDAIREFFRMMEGGDALLVANYKKNNIENYIGQNTMLELGFAHYKYQDIYLVNPMPDMPYIQTELESFNPSVIHGDLSKIPLKKPHSTAQRP
jgi:hypothetical protein